MKIALHGATGRMGRTLARLCAEAGDLQIVGAVSDRDDPAIGRDVGDIAGVGTLGVQVGFDLDAALLGADVAIDFSLARATDAFFSSIERAKVPFVMGTTGLSEAQVAKLGRLSELVPLIWSRNMSLGVQVLAELVKQAVSRLGPSFDAEIVEIHHHNKVDSPSGTALRLADAVREARPKAVQRLERAGIVGARPRDEVGVFGVRGGDVIGDHTVYLFGPGERIELTHRAGSRDLFAHGALRAARFLVGKPPGSYTIQDVLADG
jgi:4-hydroxy-tetrahydrodipicolinate reductase